MSKCDAQGESWKSALIHATCEESGIFLDVPVWRAAFVWWAMSVVELELNAV